MTLADPDALLPVAAAAFLFAGTIKGLVGIGMPTAAIATLSQFTDPRTAIALLFAPMFVANLWQMYRAGRIVATARRMRPFLLAMMPPMLIVASLAARVSQQTMMLIVGCVILVFVASGMVRGIPRIPDRHDRTAQALFGVAAGTLGGLSAIWGPPMVIYLVARETHKDDFIRVTGLLVFAGSLPLYLGYWHAGVIGAGTLSSSALMLVPTLAGFTLGEFLRRRVGNARFRKLVLLVFALMGMNLLRRALLGG